MGKCRMGKCRYGYMTHGYVSPSPDDWAAQSAPAAGDGGAPAATRGGSSWD